MLLNDCAAVPAFYDSPEYMSMAVAKQSEYKDVFSEFINQIKITGVFDKLVKTYDIDEECQIIEDKALGKVGFKISKLFSSQNTSLKSNSVGENLLNGKISSEYSCFNIP